MKILLVLIVALLAFSCTKTSQKQTELNWSEEWQGRIYPPSGQ